MPTLRLSIDLVLDGESLPGFPLARQVQADLQQGFEQQLQPADPATPIPDSIINSIRALLVRASDGPVEVQLNAVAGVVVRLNRGGILLAFDVNNAGDKMAANNLLQNTSPLVVTVKGIVIGNA